VPPLVVGIDVGGSKKGFHAVVLTEDGYHSKSEENDAKAIVDWCREINAHAIGVDAPCRWSTTGKARPAELELMAEKIGCFPTPKREIAENHPKNHYGWMLNGSRLFSLLEQHYVLFDGNPVRGSHAICFETFPQAIGCAVAGALVSAKRKATIRRALLERARIGTQPLTNIDSVDAALCAIAAIHLLNGSFKCYGEKETGFIVVPRPL
jgi:predicted nuclease with RNAse H fold